ncbi:MAG: DUF952 domain-containing protein [Ferruginibacter sp.]
MIYHITTKKQWIAAKELGFFREPSLHTEGFIHNSTEAQVAGVLERHYKGISDLILLHIEETKLAAVLKYELAPSAKETFPHIFGPINLDAVVKITDI